MQIKKYLPKSVYQVAKIDEGEYSAKAYERLKKLEISKKLRREGCTEKTVLEAIGLSRACFYRWKARYKEFGLAGLEDESRRPRTFRKRKDCPDIEKHVLIVRKANPLWGKAKITVILTRDYKLSASESCVGRILKKLVVNGKIRPTCFYRGHVKVKKKRAFLGHAKRWKYGMKAEKPGELVQIDHAMIELPNGEFVRHFDAICPITKIMVQQVYSCATSSIAADFLQLVQQQFPFPLLSVQVDGGSEFMGEFELACQRANIHLWVLPPKRPQYNGTVERSHATVKYEFYYQYAAIFTLNALRKALAVHVHRYNTYRPHQSLLQKTPWQYYQQYSEATSKVSYVVN